MEPLPESKHCCPRCGYLNQQVARYCGQCGVNLAALSIAGGSASASAMAGPKRRRWGRWVVLLMLLMGVVLGSLALRLRVRPNESLRRVVMPGPEHHQRLVPYWDENARRTIEEEDQAWLRRQYEADRESRREH